MVAYVCLRVIDTCNLMNYTYVDYIRGLRVQSTEQKTLKVTNIFPT
jgi:hypothetical protein